MELTASVLRSGGLLVALLSLVGAGQAVGASIGLFSTPDCSSCNLVVPPGETRELYVRALTEGIAPDIGFVGAALKVVGLPVGWSAVTVRNPQAAASIGDLFGPDGAWIAFSTNIPGTCIDLYTVSLIATTSVTEGRLRVEGVPSGWNPARICPLFFPGCGICDFDICVGGGTLFLDSESECDVSIEIRTWAQVKVLYR